MANDSTYEMFDLENAEFTFDVDVSALPCGINGAVYFTQMDSDGGLSKYSGNTAGAEYGTGKLKNSKNCYNADPYSKATVMHNVLRISNSSMARQTLLTGPHPLAIPTRVQELTELAAPKWTSGKPTLSLRLTRHTSVQLPSKHVAKMMLTVVLVPRTEMPASVTKTGAISTHIGWETSPSMVLERLSIPPASSPSLPNSL